MFVCSLCFTPCGRVRVRVKLSEAAVAEDLHVFGGEDCDRRQGERKKDVGGKGKGGGEWKST